VNASRRQRVRRAGFLFCLRLTGFWQQVAADSRHGQAGNCPTTWLRFRAPVTGTNPEKKMTIKSGKQTSASIWWIRRDLRLHDNAALHQARKRAGMVIPLFIMDPAALPSGCEAGAERRKAFLFGGLQALDEDLARRGSRLVVREGAPCQVLDEVVRESGATAICAEEEYSPDARRRDADVAARHPFHLVPGVAVHHPDAVHKADGNPYTVFTPFRKAWKAVWKPAPCDLLAAPGTMQPMPALASVGLPQAARLEQFPPGEAEARRRLASFMRDPIYQYAQGRERPGVAGTSRLSPYLRFGMLSAREALIAAESAGLEEAAQGTGRRGVEIWINEIIWRDFYLSILFHFPDVLQRAFQCRFREIEWRRDAKSLKAWQRGETGYPIVDAGMRELLATGWMHNRVRMIVASFLVKDLLINWQEGEKWFMQHLVDGDPAANNGGWQWAAGVGTDAAPYFRIFSPILQSKKHDAGGKYIRRWIPELAALPDKYIHEPWRTPGDLQRRLGCEIGKKYPLPIVDHGKARVRALQAYRMTPAAR
jgi:deoxyribodipyrimidine photo-lyase